MTTRSILRWLVSFLILVAAYLALVASTWITRTFALGDGHVPPVLLVVSTEMLLVGGSTVALSHAERLQTPTVLDYLRQTLLVWLLSIGLLVWALVDGFVAGPLLGLGFATASAAALIANAVGLWVYSLVVPAAEA